MDDIRTIPIPSQLLEIPHPPKQLYARGKDLDEEELFLTVVGSRAYTPYGRAACEHLISELQGAPITIVSGLALGIDAIAHEAALRAGLRTVAVPGSGLGDAVLYPRSNLSLAHRVLGNGGTLLSEHEPDFRATKWSFVERNRIMAGLSRAVLIIEAGEKSGTLVTARLATDYNRDVLAVPGEIFSEQAKGPNMLIGLGAAIIRSGSDILHALGLREEDAAPSLFEHISMSDDERYVYELLREPCTREELVIRMQRSPQEASVLIMKMELHGVIHDDRGILRRR